MMVGRELKKLQQEYQNLEIKEIEVTTNPRLTLRHGVRMIPTLKAADGKLSGFILTSSKVREFIQELYENEQEGRKI